MSIYCNLFGHQFVRKENKCEEECMRCHQIRPLEHQWDGCTCIKCNKTRNQGHRGNGCMCIKCNTKRDENHEWNGCMCKVCNKKRDEYHEWNGCMCIKCNKSRDEEHEWDGCKCIKCNETKHTFEPVSDKCEDVCTVCGTIREVQHKMHSGKCVRCNAKEEEMWMIFIQNGRARQVLENALTYVMRCSTDPNVTEQCSLVKNKVQHYFRGFTMGDFILSKACLIRYMIDIPKLKMFLMQEISENTLTQLRKLGEDENYIKFNLLPELEKEEKKEKRVGDFF